MCSRHVPQVLAGVALMMGLAAGATAGEPADDGVCASDRVHVLAVGCYRLTGAHEPLGGERVWLPDPTGGRVLQIVTGPAAVAVHGDGKPTPVACPPGAVVIAPAQASAGEYARLVDAALRVQEDGLREVARLNRVLEAQQAQLAKLMAAIATAPASPLAAAVEPADQPRYLAIDQLHPGQLRISTLNVADKVKAAKASGHVHDGGRSILPLAKALPVVRASFGYVLVDGHHDVMASLQLGATTVPVVEVDDLSALSPDGFWDEAHVRGYVYPFDLAGQPRPPPRRFAELVDDPNRYFATITARKCASASQATADSTGPEYPLWVKVGKDVPFLELMISDALTARGFTYKPREPLEPALVEKARRLLAAEVDARPSDDPLVRLRLLTERVPVASLPLVCGLPEGPHRPPLPGE